MGLFDKNQDKKYIINNKEIHIKCSKNLNNIANFILKILEELDTKENCISDNHVIRIGFMAYKVVKKNNFYKLLTIDLDDNSLNNYVDDLSISFNYFLRQSNIINKTNTSKQSIDTFYDDNMFISKKSLTSQKKYMVRNEINNNDCGWYLGAVDEEKTNNPNDYVKIKTYELRKFCDVAIDILQLPVGTLVMINGNKIIDIVDKNNKSLMYIKN